MAFTEKFTKLKDFNPGLLEKEIEALNLPEGSTIWYMGFDEKDKDTVTPADLTEPRVIPKTPLNSPVAIANKAVKGEIHVLSKIKLTEKQVGDIDAKLDAHDATMKSDRQLALAQKVTDLAALKAKMADAGVTIDDLNLMARLLLEALA
jgi:hypothetical protein